MTTETITAAPPPRDGLVRAVPLAVETRADDGDGDGMTLFGHFAVFNRWTEIDSYFEGHFLERIAPGAFKKTFRDQGDRIRVLLEHGYDPELGNKPIAAPNKLSEDETGAYYEARLFDGVPQLVIDGLRAGQYGASFRFSVLREEFVAEPGESEHNPQGLPERTLKELRVPEFGPVAFAAYPDATADLRNLALDPAELAVRALARDPARGRAFLERVAPTLIDKQHETGPAERADNDDDTGEEPTTAPSHSDAGLEPTSVKERRDPDTRGRYGLEEIDQRPSWAL